MRKIISRARKLRAALWDLFKNSRFYRWVTISSAVLVVLSFVLPLWLIVPNLGDERYIPLHYNIYFGVDRFGPWYYIFVPPTLGALLLILNVIFEGVYVKREHVLSMFFAVSTIVVETILFGAMVLMVLLNT